MKCDSCSNEFEKIKEYGFYIGKSAGTNVYGEMSYQMNTEPIKGYVCPMCLSIYRSIFETRKLFIISGIFVIAFLLLILLFYYLDYEGWRIFSIVGASIAGLSFLAVLYLHFDTASIGDSILAMKYSKELRKMGYDTYCTRSDYSSKNFKSLPF